MTAFGMFAFIGLASSAVMIVPQPNSIEETGQIWTLTENIEVAYDASIEKADEVAQFIVESADFEENSGTDILITGKFTYGNNDAKVGLLVENPDRMPDLYMHHNHFKNFPHNRISGAGHIIIENNMSYCISINTFTVNPQRIFF